MKFTIPTTDGKHVFKTFASTKSVSKTYKLSALMSPPLPSRGTRAIYAWVDGRAGDGFDKTFAAKSFSGFVKGIR